MNLRRLIAGILRLKPGDRPNMNEIFLNLFELSVLKDFLVKPLEDEIWQDMGNYIFSLSHFANNLQNYNIKCIFSDHVEKIL